MLLLYICTSDVFSFSCKVWLTNDGFKELYPFKAFIQAHSEQFPVVSLWETHVVLFECYVEKEVMSSVTARVLEHSQVGTLSVAAVANTKLPSESEESEYWSWILNQISEYNEPEYVISAHLNLGIRPSECRFQNNRWRWTDNLSVFSQDIQYVHTQTNK